jgi:uncharacterized membrane protein YozB (DUF420 family)
VILLAVHPLATLNAVLNSLATILLIAGWMMIRRGHVRAHRLAMVSAFVISTIFLVSYLTYHALEGSRPFLGEGAIRPVYYTILITHVLLAAVVPVLAVSMLFLAWRARWRAHRRLGRITLPIWLYVSVTGVVIYLMLYHLYPGVPPVADKMAFQTEVAVHALADNTIAGGQTVEHICHGRLSSAVSR